MPQTEQILHLGALSVICSRNDHARQLFSHLVASERRSRSRISFYLSRMLSSVCCGWVMCPCLYLVVMLVDMTSATLVLASVSSRGALLLL